VRILALACLAAVLWTFLAVTVKTHGFFDLSVYDGALRSWVREGGSLYDYSVPDSVFGFTYPPFAALVMLPLAFLPWSATVVVSVAITVACAAGVLYLLMRPVARRRGWDTRYAAAVAVIVAPAFEPFMETLLFGQINLVLVLLVTVDLLVLARRGSRFTGIGVGLATAIKLTPGIFIVYLLVTRRWRAALVASGTAAAATLLAFALAPGASRVFWTSALWNTSRVGDLDFIANQSIMGALARWNPASPSRVVEVIAGLAVAAIWFVKVRRADAAGDVMTGIALTGILGCLVSPVTWIHHLVWLAPALVALADGALGDGLPLPRPLTARFPSLAASRPVRRHQWVLLGTAALAVAILCTRLIWHFHNNYGTPVTWLFSNGYLWLTLALLVVLPAKIPLTGDSSEKTGKSHR
jgi:alpha-1,2-mannosyltransferase